jgi:hypothetical protein
MLPPDRDHDDGNKTARTYNGLQRRFRPSGDEEVRRRPHQFRNGDKGSAWIVHCQIVNGDILTLAKAELSQLRSKGLILFDPRRIVEGRPEEGEPDAPARLLPIRRQRPSSRRAADNRDEFTPSHGSSLARTTTPYHIVE